jgi:hypothetical protein
MRYDQFREAVRGFLEKRPKGATWGELRTGLRLAYRTPCYTWLHRMEDEIGLRRTRGSRGMVWTVVPNPKTGGSRRMDRNRRNATRGPEPSRRR